MRADAEESAEQPTGTCLTCTARDAEPPLLVCEPCATRIPHRIRDLGDLHHQLVTEADEDTDDWTGTAVLDERGRPIKGRDSQVLAHADPTTAMPAGPLKGRSRQPTVSGTAEPSVPVDLQALDLDGPIVRDGGIPVGDHRAIRAGQLVPLRRVVTVTRRMWVEGVMHEFPCKEKQTVRNTAGRIIRVPAVDEVGPKPIAVRLDAHILRWIAARGQGEHRPVPTVAALLAWIGNRLDWAFRRDGLLWQFDSDIRHMIAQVRGVLGLHDPLPETFAGIQCRACDRMGTLTRAPGDPYIECGGCNDLMTDTEYGRWVGLLADRERHRLGRAGVKAVLRAATLKPTTGGAPA